MAGIVRFFRCSPAFEAAMQRIETGLIPRFIKSPGFRSVRAVRCHGGPCINLFRFDSQDNMAEAFAMAQRWSEHHLHDLLPDLTHVVERPATTLFSYRR